jgi:signal transduction histidine kinase
MRLEPRYSPVELPPPLQRAIAEQTPVMEPDLQGEQGPGLGGRSGSGIYTVLPARGSVIGLLAVESRTQDAFTARDLEVFRGFVEPVALGIDNARWFARLRTLGADEERSRIARDLHDSIGQSLAYLAFELDRVVKQQEKGEDLGASLDGLRNDLRGVIGEVRDTLYDLRTDVADAKGMAEVMDEYLGRVRDRTSLTIETEIERTERLPILQEREMWRIAQEALTNIERHADANRVSIRWRCAGETAVLEITDDGQGFPMGRAGRLDSYGILGMRERASSMGATLDIESAEGEGTRVTCELDRS